MTRLEQPRFPDEGVQIADKNCEDARIDTLVDWLKTVNLPNLASEISQERLARRVFEAHAFLDRYEIQKHLSEENLDYLLGKIIEIQTSTFDKAASYNNLIISLGYAGFFAIWSFVRDFLPELDEKVSALCLGSSLLIFIVWTLTVSVNQTFMIRNIAQEIGKDYDDLTDKLDSLKTVEQLNYRKAARMFVYWPFAFILSILLGFSGGIIILNALLMNILNIDLYISDIIRLIVGG